MCRVLVLFMLCAMFSVSVRADSYAPLPDGCATLCNTEQWENATKCYRETLDPPAAYLATATCAFNSHKDDVAEQYALKSASSRNEWTTFLNRFGYTFIRTGGLGETYVLAYVASGGSRHESTAKRYLRTSGQCMSSEDPEACAELYFASVESRYRQRNIGSVRSAGITTRRGIALKVLDAEGHPIKHATLTIICGDRQSSNITDTQGTYVFTQRDLDITSPCSEVKAFVKLEYHDVKDAGKIKFVYLWNNQPVYFYKKLVISNVSDLTQVFQLNESLPAAQYGGLPNDLAVMDDFGISYYEMARVFEYYRDVLNVRMSYKMPLHVLMFVNSGSTHYDPSQANSRIVIRDTNSDKNHSFRPKNREWHEFSHFVMFNNYGRWPQPPAGSPVPEVNHNGYSNPNTADSYTEGFAEFMTLMIAKHYGEADWKVYSTWGNMDKRIKAWQNYGREEEMAIAATLLDLVDAKDDDQVEMDFKEIWDIIKDYRQNNYVAYTAFRQAAPRQAEAIDKAYIANGFFNDKTAGNGIWEPKESWHNTNGDNIVDAAELKIDYAREPGLNMSWMLRQDNEEPGYSANYQRLKRENTVEQQGHYIKVDNDVPQYKVTVTFKDNPSYNYVTKTENVNGKVFVYVPSWENDATIRVEPLGVKFSKPLEFTTKQFEAAGARPLEQGHFLTHDFGITGAVPARPSTPTQEIDDDTPYWETKDLVAVEADREYRQQPEQALAGTGGDGDAFPIIFVIVLVVAFALATFFVMRRRRRRGRTQE